jgi:hypothetical protein
MGMNECYGIWMDCCLNIPTTVYAFLSYISYSLIIVSRHPIICSAAYDVPIFSTHYIVQYEKIPLSAL